VGILSALGAGCGGGGGGGSDAPATQPSKSQTPPEQQPVEKTPLLFNMGTAPQVAAQGIRQAELALLYTHSAVQVLRRDTIPTGSTTRNCAQEGTESIDFADVDHDGKPTKGDSVTVRYESCRNDDSLRLDGQFTLALTAATVGTGVSAFGGTVTFASFKALPKNAAGPLELNGNVQFSSTISGAMEQISVNTDDKGLKMASDDPANAFTETLVMRNASKNLDHGNATYSVSLDTTLQSELLHGQIDVTTPTVVVGPLDSFPTSGMFRVQGSAAIVDVSGSSHLADARYSDGTNNNVSLGSSNWTDFCSLFFFWDSDHGSSADVRDSPPGVLYTSIPDSGVLSITPGIMLQLARPLASGEPADGSFTFNSEAGDIDAKISGAGSARLTLEPTTPLAAKTAYTLAPTRSSFKDKNGGALVIGSYSFTTQ